MIYSQLEKYVPYVLDEIKDHSQDKKIFSLLTDKGQFAYKAALWQFENAISSNYGIKDAGMLCLSYMRILELEINERIINCVRTDKNKIQKCFDKFIQGFSGDEQKKYKETEIKNSKRIIQIHVWRIL